MKVFDSRWVGPHGIGRFAVELQTRMTEFRAIDLSGRPSSPLDPWRLHRYLRATTPEYFFSPGYNVPARSSTRFSFTLHDLNHLRVPDNSSFAKRLYYEALIRPAMHTAEVVFTGSEYARGEICEWARADDRRVVAVGYGVSDEFTSEGAKYVTRKPYLLFVGNHKPHKNVVRMLQAFARSSLERDLDFILTGTPCESLRHLVSAERLCTSVKFLGVGITDRHLAEVYRGATATVLVSEYEGFGLPIVESMACGTPVLTSRAASMPEVAGGAALLVSPWDIEEIAHNLRVLVHDQELQSRLRTRGLLRAAMFSWDKTAQVVQNQIDMAIRSS